MPTVGNILVMAVSYQVHFSLNSPDLFLSFSGAAQLQYLMPIFWIGFNLMMFPSSGFVKRFGAYVVMAFASAVCTLATYGTMIAPNLELLVAAQFVSGACWGAINVAAFSAVIQFGRRDREGAFLGCLFAVMSSAALLRIGAYLGDIETTPEIGKALAWGPSWGWLVATLLLLAIVARVPRKAMN